MLLRRIVPASYRTALSKLRRRLLNSVLIYILPRLPDESLIAGLRTLPDTSLITIRSDLAIVKKMDYNRHDIFLNIESKNEYRTRSRSCQKEPETIEWIETYVREGDVVYDIGANIGAYSLVTCKHTGGKAKIYAFEPAFPSFTQLCKNVILNGCQDSIVPLQIALSSQTRINRFNYHSLVAGGAFHALGEAIDSKGNLFEPVLVQPVLSYRMDDLIRDFLIPVPNHIKLDVDGNELDVLQGANRTLADNRLRTLMVEVDEDFEDASRNLLQYLVTKVLFVHSKHRRSGNLFNYLFLRRRQ